MKAVLVQAALVKAALEKAALVKAALVKAAEAASLHGWQHIALAASRARVQKADTTGEEVRSLLHTNPRY